MAALAARSDDETCKAVGDALAADVRLDGSGINVDVVGGTVYLTGVVPTLVQKRIAQEIAVRIKGVLDVDNQLLTSPLLTRSDIDVESDVKAALKRDAWVDEKRITVRADEGTVYLSGTAVDFISRSAAEEAARTVRGVIEVVNDIAVVPAPARLDGEIAEDVRRDIERNVRIKPKQIKVEVTDGVVFLRGTVSTAAQRWIAEDIARWIPGVLDVVNELSVSGQ
ncbi:MAG: BON domain-containing protein [Chloroflexi bacterium]|nr:BON domain-containing protein [Chloroflexota bacterium]